MASKSKVGSRKLVCVKPWCEYDDIVKYDRFLAYPLPSVMGMQDVHGD